MSVINIVLEIKALLKAQKLTVSCAESCTGGLLSSTLTDVQGSSIYLHQSFVTYANNAKNRILGVKNETLEEFGAVSRHVALEMVQGVLKNYDCDIAVSITGFLEFNEAKKEIPQCYIAVANQNSEQCFHFKPDSPLSRVENKQEFVRQALLQLKSFLENL